jgi:hypothetical protein
MTKLSRWVVLCALALSVPASGCGPGPDDAAGQAGLLADPAKRQPAFENVMRLYHASLTAADGDRTKPGVRAVVDASVEPLVAAYTASQGDLRMGRLILDLLAEMRDPRALPAYLKALEFELDAGERHAQTAANAIRDVTVPDGQKAALAAALVHAFNTLPGDRAGNDARPADRVLQIDFIKTLSYLGDAGAEPLAAIVTTDDLTKVTPPVVLASAIHLGRVATAATVPALIKSLFRNLQNGPNGFIGLTPFAVAGLVRVGRPAVNPLIAVVRGQDPAALAASTAAFAVLRTAAPGAVAGQTPATMAKTYAMQALAALGAPEAFPLIAEQARTGEIRPRFEATMMLTQLTLPPAQQAEVRTVITNVLTAATGDSNAQIRNGLLSIALQMFDPGLLPIVLAHVRDHDEYAQVRISAMSTYALLANKTEAAALKAVIDAEPTIEHDGLQEQLRPALPLIEVSTACDENIACWRGKLSDANPLIARKAIVMLGRFGVGNAEVIAALIPLLDSPTIDLRFAALYALDHVANHGSADVVTKLDDVTEREDPLSMQIRTEALRIASRIRSRT